MIRHHAKSSCKTVKGLNPHAIWQTLLLLVASTSCVFTDCTSLVLPQCTCQLLSLRGCSGSTICLSPLLWLASGVHSLPLHPWELMSQPNCCSGFVLAQQFTLCKEHSTKPAVSSNLSHCDCKNLRCVLERPATAVSAHRHADAW